MAQNSAATVTEGRTRSDSDNHIQGSSNESNAQEETKNNSAYLQE